MDLQLRFEPRYLNNTEVVELSVQDTSSKMKGMENALEDLQDKLYELDKSWENNLVFYGINNIKDEEERPQLLENKVREILKSVGVKEEKRSSL